MDTKLQEYAKLLIEVGLNVQKGQTLIISSPVECASFARLCADAAYDAGCREVIMNWSDDYLSRQKFLRADASVFDDTPEWREKFFTSYAEMGAAYLAIAASDPETLKGVDPDRLVRSQKSGSVLRKTFDRLQMSNGFPWCIASVPIPSWAATVFPELPEDRAMEKLWDAILRSVRIQGDGTAVSAWRQHLDTLGRRKDLLNKYHFKYLHYTNSLGTDLTIQLPEDHLWAAGNSVMKNGVEFVANMPTRQPGMLWLLLMELNSMQQRLAPGTCKILRRSWFRMKLYGLSFTMTRLWRKAKSTSFSYVSRRALAPVGMLG